MGRFAKKTTDTLTLRGIVDNCPERFFGSTNKGNPMQIDGGTKFAVDLRLISGLSPGRRLLFVLGCGPLYRRFFVFVNPIHVKHVRDFCIRSTIGRLLFISVRQTKTNVCFNVFIICRTQNPDIQRAERFGAAQSGAAGRSGTGQDRTPTGRFAQDTTDPFAPQGIVDNCPQRLLGSTNKGNPM